MSEGSYAPDKEGWREYGASNKFDVMVYVNEYGIAEISIEAFEKILEKAGYERSA